MKLHYASGVCLFLCAYGDSGSTKTIEPETDELAEIIYTVDLPAIGDLTVSGSITTDGKVGVLTPFDFLDWDLTVTSPSIGATNKMLGPGHGAAYNSILIQALDVTATAGTLFIPYPGIIDIESAASCFSALVIITPVPPGPNAEQLAACKGTSVDNQEMGLSLNGIQLAKNGVRLAKPVHRPGPFVIVDLDPTTAFYASGLNDKGQVVGFIYGIGDHSATGTHPTTEATIYSHGTVTGLGTLGGTNSRATGINNAGQVIGFSDLPGDTISHAALFSINGVPLGLGTPGFSSAALAINKHGLGAGVAYFPGNTTNHAALFVIGGSPVDLGTLGGTQSGAVGINKRGQAVGSSQVSGAASHQHAALFAAGSSPIDLGTLEGDNGNSSANAINDRGFAVGYSSAVGGGGSGPIHATLFSVGAAPVDLGRGASSQASGINDFNQVVGFAYARGALWSKKGDVWMVIDLNTLIDSSLGWTIDTANAINNRGWILAGGHKANNVEHSLLLVPCAQAPDEASDDVPALVGCAPKRE